MIDAGALWALRKKSTIRIEGISTITDVIVFFGTLTQVALGQDLVVLGDFNYPVICWKSNIAGHRSSNKFLEGAGGNLLAQKIQEAHSVAALHWVLTKHRGISCKFKAESPWLKQALTNRKILKRVGIQFHNFHLQIFSKHLPYAKHHARYCSGEKSSNKRISR